MVRQWHRGAIVVALTSAAALAATDAGRTGLSFDAQTEIANATLKTIATGLAEIEHMEAQAEVEGKAVKASCIAEKLRRAHRNEEAAATVMKGWALGVGDREYAQRQLDRILLLQVYSLVYEQEARNCTDAKAAGKGLTVDVNISKDPGLGSPLSPTKPPILDRPAVVSPF